MANQWFFFSFQIWLKNIFHATVINFFRQHLQICILFLGNRSTFLHWWHYLNYHKFYICSFCVAWLHIRYCRANSVTTWILFGWLGPARSTGPLSLRIYLHLQHAFFFNVAEIPWRLNIYTLPWPCWFRNCADLVCLVGYAKFTWA